MSAEATSDTTRESVTDVIESIAAAENPEAKVLERFLEHMRQKDASLAEAIYCCAIPRRFDTEVLSILRQALSTGTTCAEEDERLLAELLTFTFVRDRSDGGYVYDDNTRSILLKCWREDSRRGQFQFLNERLVTFYKERHKQAQELERALERVRPVIYCANPARSGQLVSLIEKRIVGALFEGLYHAALRSSDTAYRFFVHYFHQYEVAGRLGICEALLSTTIEYLDASLPEAAKDSALRWLSYYQARVSRRLHRNDEAEEILRKLLLESDQDVQLKLWVLGELGSLLQEQFKLREANEFFEKELAMKRETKVDLYNLAVSYSRVAELHWCFSDLNRAAENYREAIRVSQDPANLRRDMEVHALSNLSGVLSDAGKWTEAFYTAWKGFEVALTELPQDRVVAQAVVTRLMYLLSRYDPRLLETLFTECIALAGELADPFQKLSLDQTYCDLLRESGQLGRADEWIADLRERAAQLSDRVVFFGHMAVFSDILLSEALLREHQGQVEQSIALYDELVERSRNGRQGTAWHYVAALSNRAIMQSEFGNLQEAKIGLAKAIAKWKEIGHQKNVALMQIYIADVLRRQGQFKEADAALEGVRGVLTAKLACADEHQMRGEIYRNQAQWVAAREQYQQALAINQSLNRFRNAAQNLAQIASIASSQGRWDEAAECTSEAAALWQVLEKWERERPSLDTRQADKLNAEGVQRFSQAGENRKNNVEQARQKFRSAIERFPDNFLYHLNLAYACGELQEWGEAAQSLEAALDRGPRWLHAPCFRERIAAYRRNLA